MTRSPKALRLATLLFLVLAACGGGGGGGGAGGGGGHDAHGDGGGAVPAALGEPADPADADRTVEVAARDPYSFSPASLTVEPGETILFKVTNEGKQLHEFMLAAPGHHDHADMADSGVMINPGETQELAWTFADGGQVEFACHVDNHYESGMRGVITVGS